MSSVIVGVDQPDVARRARPFSALVQVAAGGLGLAAGAALLPSAFDPFHPQGDGPAWVRALVVGIGWAFVVAGLLAARIRADRRTPVLLLMTGMSWFLAFSLGTDIPVLWTLSSAMNVLPILLIFLLLLGFPDGTLGGSVPRLTVTALSLAFALDALSILLYDPVAFGCATCRPDLNVLLLSSNPEWINVKTRVVGPLTTLAVAMLIAALAARWSRASKPQRRVLAPLYLPAVVWATSYLAYLLFQGAVGVTIYEAPVRAYHIALSIFGVALLLIPLCFVIGLTRARARRARVGELVVALSNSTAPPALQEVLGRTLGDASVQVVLWCETRQRFEDADGHIVELPDEGRAVTVLTFGGERLGAVLHDPALLDDPRLIDSVAAAAALALYNDRLQAEILARLDDVRRSRAQIVEAADAERRRVERDLHDGAQQRLISLAIALRMAEGRARALDDARLTVDLAGASQELDNAIAELRELARGIYPPVLVQEGLAAALQELAERSPIPVRLRTVKERFDRDVETSAYFIASEALTNAAKHSFASEIRIQITREQEALLMYVEDDGIGGADPAGTGLRGMRHRVDALEGVFSVNSPPGRGTELVVRIPCVSPSRTTQH